MKISVKLAGLFALLLSSATVIATPLYVSEDWTEEGSFTSGIEGPAIDSNGTLYAVNFGKEGTIGKVTGKNQASLHLTLPEGSVGNAIRFTPTGEMLIADYVGHNLLAVNTQGQIRVFAHNHAMNQPNDIVISDTGTIYASDPAWTSNSGQLWRINTDGSTERLESDMGTTNGIELSPDGRVLYINESVQRVVWAYDVDASGALSNKRELYRFTDFGMDGMSTDIGGNLYSARYCAGNIAVRSRAGKLLRQIPLTGQHPTNITFGGSDGKRAFVTMQKRGNIESFLTEIPGSDWRKQQNTKSSPLPEAR